MTPSPESEKTAPGTEPDIDAPPAPRPFVSEVLVDIAGLSHPGRVRPNNEDHFIISRLGRYLETVGTNVPEDLIPPRFEESIHGMIVADGVGGGTAGEVASRTAISTLLRLATTSPNWIFRLDDERFVTELLHRLKERLGQIHAKLIEEARVHPDLKGFGTTMTLGLSIGNVLFLAHIGDSRAYLLREGRLRQLTRDHTLAQDLADKGFATGHGVPVEKLRHVLTQALTDHDRPLDPDVHAFGLEHRDRVLLCTDGLTDMVGDDVLTTHLKSDAPSADIARRLIEEALRAGGNDNVTAVIASYRMP